MSTQTLLPPTDWTFSPELVSIDAERFRQCVDRTSFGFTHQLMDHPAFDLENLVELSLRLPESQREYVFAKQEFGSHEQMNQYAHAQAGDELTTDDLIRQIEQQNIIIVLRNVEIDPIYGRFVNRCLDGLASLVEPICGPMSYRESYIFVSPPRAYTPYHYDPEQNFFMQIRGRKQMATYDVSDRSVLPETALEKFYGNNQQITKCDKSQFERYQLNDLYPGDGVYVPVTSPHWVRTLDEVSVSISINFRTPSSVRRARAFRVNHFLRKLGWSPRPVSPQASTVVDRLKSAALSGPAVYRRLRDGFKK